VLPRQKREWGASSHTATSSVFVNINVLRKNNIQSVQ
jgi:hypothetical protein